MSRNWAWDKIVANTVNSDKVMKTGTSTANDLDTAGGTVSGILMRIFSFLDSFTKSQEAAVATMIEVSTALLPK